jgi:hypothetical protein
VEFMIDEGVDQFLDIGAGIPTADNTHQVARRRRADTRVVYVDNDPVAVAHSQAILGDDPRAAVLHIDLRDPDAILGAPELTRLVDLTRPVGLLLLAVLHFVADDEPAHAAVARLTGALAPGSYLAISHVTDPTAPERGEGLRRVAERSPVGVAIRPREQIVSFFDGLDLVEPGLVTPGRWRPTSPQPSDDMVPGLAGVGRKP